jgi:hypothetical protein
MALSLKCCHQHDGIKHGHERQVMLELSAASIFFAFAITMRSTMGLVTEVMNF